MNLLKISRFPDFIQYFPDFSQRFPDFLPTKFFEVHKCERCGSLNPRLGFIPNHIQIYIIFYSLCVYVCPPTMYDISKVQENKDFFK